MKRAVRNLIQQKGLHEFSSISPRASLLEALFEMDESNSSALLAVQNVMTTRVYYAEPQFTLEECLQIMSEARVRHLPVLENGVPIAMVSMRHIMEVLVEDKDNQIRDLTAYITGRSYIYEFDHFIPPVPTPLFVPPPPRAG